MNRLAVQRRLGRILARPAVQGRMVGVVDGTGPLTVSVRGATGLAIGKLASYTPTIGDVVAIDGRDGAWMVTGKLADGS